MRLLLLQKQTMHGLTRIVHPRAVVPVNFGGAVVPPQVMQWVLAFMLIYGFMMKVVCMLMLLSGLDLVTAATATIATIACIDNAGPGLDPDWTRTGPGLGQAGPACKYPGLSDLQIWACTFAMLLGRLELLCMPVLFTPAFWCR